MQLEDIREKMAENIHELWAMDKIDVGWTHGPVTKRDAQHNCLLYLMTAYLKYFNCFNYFVIL